MGDKYASFKWVSYSVLSLIPGIILAFHNSYRLVKANAITNLFFKAIAILYLFIAVVILAVYLMAAINWWGRMQNEK